MADAAGDLSRRDFMRLNAALLAAAGLHACGWPDERPDIPPDTRSSLRLLRAEDLLALRVELHNLRIEHRRGQPARLVRIRAGEEALVAVGFPGQHILEQAYPEAAGSEPIRLPAITRIARPSTLVFKLPPNIGHIDITIAALLDWQNWIPMLPESPIDGAAKPSPPDRTVIELPYGLVLRPAETARWWHATRPVTHHGRTELWHTRLVAEEPTQPAALTILPPQTPPTDPAGIDTALTPADRRQLVGRSARTRTLILSPMGGWLELRGEWETDPAITQWQHTATAGQDQRVVVQHADGFLYPFGQRATLISVTERKLTHLKEDPPPYALLRKRDFIVIKIPTVAYVHGRMAFSRMTTLDRVTPPLVGVPTDGRPFWIQTRPDTPFRFRLEAQDWAERRITLDAPAVFVADTPEAINAARVIYATVNDTDKISALNAQPAAVVKFDPGGGDCRPPAEDTLYGCDRWGKPLTRPRNLGDTTVQLLQMEFDADPAVDPVQGEPPFSCRTRRMEIRVPSLEPYLDENLNRGWFDLLDPDAPDARKNLGEVFAVARREDGKRIPMYFDRQSDRCGGIAAPSFDVDGLSRVRGPIGDAGPNGPMYAGGTFEPTAYFTPDRATLLGGFNLSELLVPTNSDTTNPAIPTISFTVTRNLPDKKDEDNGNAPVKEDKNPDETDNRPKKEATRSAEPPHWTASLALAWQIPLEHAWPPNVPIFIPNTDADGQSITRLDIAAKLTKTFRKSAPAEDRAKTGDASAELPHGEKNEATPSPSSVDWQASGKLTNFGIGLSAGDLGGIRVDFAHLGVTLGPPKPKKKDHESKKEDEKEKTPDDAKAKKKSVEYTIDYKFSAIQATGALSFLNDILEMANHLMPKADSSATKQPPVGPATLPGVDDADIKVMVGPVNLSPPEKKLFGRFDVSNLAFSVGVGLYFLPRQLETAPTPAVPPPLFAIHIADANKPLLLMAEPWGGLAYAGFNFTTQGLTGFQCSLGIAYRASFELSAATATCEGSLAGVFTYLRGQSGTPSVRLDLVLRISGQANIASIIQIYLNLTAMGTWQHGMWTFAAEISVRIKISFFAVSVRYVFSYALPGGSGGGDRLLTERPTTNDDNRMRRDEWLAYRAAFAM
jgi:hypothetical protein